MSGITVSRRDDDLIAVKTSSPSDPNRRRAEAAVLRGIDLEGIVRFVDFDERDDVLQTRYVGTDTWARTPPTTTNGVLHGLATVADTVADLHELGTTHGALTPEHVVVATGGSPVLCGLADARPIDPAGELDDLVGLAGLLRDLSADAAEPQRAALLDLARSATTGDHTARTLAEALRAIEVTAPTSTATARPSRRRPAIAGGVVVVLVAAVALAANIGSGDDPGPSSFGTEAAVSVAPTTITTSPTTSSPTTSLPPTTMLAEAEPLVGVELVHEGRRYGLGAPGDVAVVGDWDCDGTETPALLQVESETIAVFDAWPAPDSSLEATLIDMAPGATGLEVDDHDGCHRLRILEPTGSRLFTPET